MYVNDMVALEKHIEEAIDRQLADESVAKDQEAHLVINRIHNVLGEHITVLGAQVEKLGTTPGAVVKDVVASLAGTVAGLYDKIRKHPVSRMLRDDATALSLTATGYSMLHATCLALQEPAIANIALRHLRDIASLVMDLSRVIPSVVIKELAETNPAADRSAAQTAVENTIEAWSSQG